MIGIKCWFVNTFSFEVEGGGGVDADIYTLDLESKHGHFWFNPRSLIAAINFKSNFVVHRSCTGQLSFTF